MLEGLFILLQALRSFKLTVTVDPKYHPKIIGRKGAVITQIRTEHEVNIQFPDKDDDNQVRTEGGKRPPAVAADMHTTIFLAAACCRKCW